MIYGQKLFFKLAMIYFFYNCEFLYFVSNEVKIVVVKKTIEFYISWSTNEPML